MQSDVIYRFLVDVLTQLPSVFVMFACIIVAIVRWKKHPKASLLVTIALLVLVLQVFVFAAAYSMASRLFGSESQTTFSIITWLYNVLFVLALAILLLGIFIQRPPVPSRS